MMVQDCHGREQLLAFEEKQRCFFTAAEQLNARVGDVCGSLMCMEHPERVISGPRNPAEADDYVRKHILFLDRDLLHVRYWIKSCRDDLESIMSMIDGVEFKRGQPVKTIWFSSKYLEERREHFFAAAKVLQRDFYSSGYTVGAVKISPLVPEHYTEILRRLDELENTVETVAAMWLTEEKQDGLAG